MVTQVQIKYSNITDDISSLGVKRWKESSMNEIFNKGLPFIGLNLNNCHPLEVVCRVDEE